MKIPIVYLWVYKKLLQKECNPLRTKIVLEVLKRNFYQLPLSIHYKIIRDMQYYGLLEKINKKVYRLNTKKAEECKKIKDYLIK